MGTMNTRSFSEPEVLVSGRKLGLSLLASIVAAAGVGVLTYYGLAKTMGGLLGTALPQIVTFAVYATLVAVLCYSFRPPGRPPIAIHFTGVKDLVFAVGATIVLIAACALAYAFLGLFFGGFVHRLQGQGSSAWVIAILRGCLLARIAFVRPLKRLMPVWYSCTRSWNYSLC